MGNDGMDGRRCYMGELKEDAGVSMCEGICIGLRGKAREGKEGQNIWRAILLSLLPAWCLCLGSQVVVVESSCACCRVRRKNNNCWAGL